MKIFSCSEEAKGFTEKICKKLELTPGKITSFKFKNDNNFVQFDESIRSEDIFLIQTVNKPVNERIMELLITIDAAKRSSAKSITAVLPYYPYSRSDKKDQPRVPVTAKLIAKMLESAGATRILTCDLHNQAIQSYFEIPCDTLTCQYILEDYYLKKNVKDMVIVATDAGSSKKAYKYAAHLNASIALVNKERIGNTDNVRAKSIIGEIKDKNAIIFDDEVDTAGSIIAAVNILKENGVKNTYVGCTHGVLSADAIDRIAKAPIKELTIMDTIPRKEKLAKNIKVLSACDLFAEAIRRINEGYTADQIFER
ncbi:ribose-phosphate diphosphokinase [Candidatus Saccharibacteria bacterium]|nr:ribose-phosphate diphosphokinase [Candidatus Saccharibacteria bacterium]